MPQKRRFSKKPKPKPDLELARLQRMVANPFHAVAVQHGMRVDFMRKRNLAMVLVRHEINRYTAWYNPRGEVEGGRGRW